MGAVSYTHLDVYKRQMQNKSIPLFFCCQITAVCCEMNGRTSYKPDVSVNAGARIPAAVWKFIGVFYPCLLYTSAYDKEYIGNENASAVSLTLPLTKEMYNSKTLFPFFDGLIPEGWLLGVVSRNWKINVSDRFGLLLVACKDAIGNVSIREVRE